MIKTSKYLQAHLPSRSKVHAQSKKSLSRLLSQTHVSLDEFARRRQKFIEGLPSSSIAFISASSIQYRNSDAEYPHRQNSDFYYLTGFIEPDAVAVFVPGRKEGEFLLFNREKDPEKERWTGARVGQEAACEQYGVDQAFPIGELNAMAPDLLRGKKQVGYLFGQDQAFAHCVKSWVHRAETKHRSRHARVPDEFVDLKPILHTERLYKSPAEIALLRKAARLSAKAHCRMMQVCRPGLYEYQLMAEFMHEIYGAGCNAEAYPSIVASGGNACILHYTANNARLKKGDLVLIDAAGEYGYYAADITRTFPVSGRFSAEQRAIYDIVLNAQKAGIRAVRPGALWSDIQDVIVRIITQGLIDVGILHGDCETLITQNVYRNFYMHRSGHWLGLDVHDVGSYDIDDKPRPLEPGMVLTVEPGIYIDAHRSDVAKKWWNIGVRIEDDVLVTTRGRDVLSVGVPKEIDEIEALMKV